LNWTKNIVTGDAILALSRSLSIAEDIEGKTKGGKSDQWIYSWCDTHAGDRLMSAGRYHFLSY
jgi:hypothetical protein